ncbi:hypothetical protein Y1Q_0013289 [Alligator mississippiensis]|uniref:Uncharacterized protein n=1 Tax=Alligator mississippiensis TaxID=8496 RepID=A0A151MH14_ALLMI|nr:hypothetical protein Y1Q_0013289 [Alligator mississippiensis]
MVKSKITCYPWPVHPIHRTLIRVCGCNCYKKSPRQSIFPDFNFPSDPEMTSKAKWSLGDICSSEPLPNEPSGDTADTRGAKTQRLVLLYQSLLIFLATP